MPHTTKLPPDYLRVTLKGGGAQWVNLGRALHISTLFDSPTNFVGFGIEFGEEQEVIHVTDKAEVKALAKLLGYTIPGSK